MIKQQLHSKTSHTTLNLLHILPITTLLIALLYFLGPLRVFLTSIFIILPTLFCINLLFYKPYSYMLKCEVPQVTIYNLNDTNSNNIPNEEVRPDQISPFFEPEKIHQLFSEDPTDNTQDEDFIVHQTANLVLEEKDSFPNIIEGVNSPFQEKVKPDEAGSLSGINADSTQCSENRATLLSLDFSEGRAKYAKKFEKLGLIEKQLGDLEESYRLFSDDRNAVREIHSMRKEIEEIERLILRFNASYAYQNPSLNQIDSENSSKSKFSSELFNHASRSLDSLPLESRLSDMESTLPRSLNEFGELICGRIDAVMKDMQTYFTQLLRSC